MLACGAERRQIVALVNEKLGTTFAKDAMRDWLEGGTKGGPAKAAPTDDGTVDTQPKDDGTVDTAVAPTEGPEVLTGIVEHGLASQASSKIAVDFGTPEDTLKKVLAISEIGSTVLGKTIETNQKSFPDAGWQFPHGINGEANTVTMLADNKWQQYHASIYNHRVSSYSTYSVGENFAEMYTARYTNGAVPPAIGGLSIADFFNELTQAEPSELGLAAPAPTTVAPGAAAPTATPVEGGADRVSS